MPHAKPHTRQDWITVTDVATRLGCSRGTVLNMIRDGRLAVRVIRLDTFIRINRADFDQLMEKRVTAGLSA